MSIWSKAWGLMFSARISDKGLIFPFRHKSRVGLHMLFVFYPIDVLFLDEKRRVVEMKEGFKPFRFYTPKKKALFVIELGADTIKQTGTKVGDEIRF